MRSVPVLVLSLGLELLAVFAAGQENTLKIGTTGAQLALPAGWEKRLLTTTGTRDQFASGQRFFAIITEVTRVLDAQDEFAGVLDAFCIGMRGHDPKLTAQTGELQTTNGLDHLRRTVRCRVNGLALYYELHLIGRDGLYYYFMTWSPSAFARQLEKEASRLVGGLRFPAADSEWGKAAQPAPVQFRGQGYAFTVEYRRSCFTPAADPGAALYVLTDGASEKACYFLLTEHDPGRAATILGQVEQLLKGERPQLGRADVRTVKVAGGDGRQADFVTPDDKFSAVSTVVPLSETLALEIRFVAGGPLEAQRRHVAALLASLKIVKPQDLDAFPEAPAAKAPDDVPPAIAELLKQSTLLGEFPGYTARVSLAPDGALLNAAAREITRRTPGGELETLATFADHYYARQLVRHGQDLLATGEDGQVFRLGREEPLALAFRAEALDDAGNGGLLLARGSPPGVAPLLHCYRGRRPSTVWRRDAQGNERQLAKTTGAVTALAANVTVRAALMAVALGWTRDQTDASSELQLLPLADAGQPPALSLGAWSTVERLVATGDGWLVTGTPAAGHAGIYRLSPAGKPALLIGGGFGGVAVRDEQLVFTTRHRLTPAPRDRQAVSVYACPLATVAKLGPACQPFPPAVVEQIASATFATLRLERGDRLLLATRDRLAAFLAAAQQQSRQLTGQAFPSSAAALDQLLEALTAGHRLSQETRVLLAAALAQCLLEQGAIWVDARDSVAAVDGAELATAYHHPFAQAYLPNQLVAETLVGGEDARWHPAGSLTEELLGRRLLIGFDPATLREASGGRDALDQLASQLDAGAGAALRELLGQHPANRYLRELCYHELLTHAHQAVALDLARGFATGPDSDPVDVEVYAALRVQEQLTPEAAEELVRLLRATIAKDPAKPLLYLFLGQVYEAGSRAPRFALAERCYGKALELRHDQEFKTAVTARLAHVGQQLLPPDQPPPAATAPAPPPPAPDAPRGR